MILRRITEHVKAQNWFAVGLDFFIVIVGVFIGTNVTNWNDGRISHERSQEYSERLQNDLRVEYEYAVSLQEYFRDAKEASTIAFDGLSRPGEIDDRTILINIFRASQFQWYERRNATFNELVSSGELNLILDPVLRETAVKFYSNSTNVFEINISNAHKSEFRQLVDEIIDPDVRSILQTECGDKEYTSGAGVSGVFTIGYSCTIDEIDDGVVMKIVDAFRTDTNTLRALRRQAAIIDVNVFNVGYMLDLSGLDVWFKNEEKP